jgi:putative copper export protein
MEEALRSTALTILKTIGFLANGFLFGSPVFCLLVLRPSLLALPPEERERAAARGGRRLEELIGAALVASVVSVALILLLQVGLAGEVRGGQLEGRLFSSVLGSSFGTWTVLRVPLLVFLAVLLVGKAGGALRTRANPAWWAAWIGGAAALLVTTSFAGHARVAAPPLSLVNDGLHQASGAIWLAGVVAFASILPRAALVGAAALLPPAVRRFSLLALAAIGAAAVTGSINSLLDLAHPSDLWSGGYGGILGIKILVFLGILAMGAVNHFGIRRRFEAETQDLTTGGGAGVRMLFRRTIATELLLAVVILALTASLTGRAPTKEHSASRGPAPLHYVVSPAFVAISD